MLKVVEDFKDKDVVFYVVYTREPHAGQKFMGHDFSEKAQTTTHEERVENAKELIDTYGETRTILIDEFGEKSVQRTVGGGRPNSLVIVDKEGTVALWQGWSNAEKLRTKLDEMAGVQVTGVGGDASTPGAVEETGDETSDDSEGETRDSTPEDD